LPTSITEVGMLTSSTWNRFLDPVFGVAVGLTATAFKVQREQREKFPDQDNRFPALWEKAIRMNRAYWGDSTAGK
jgi:hypothetical protein